MEALARFVLAVARLFEAEGLVLKRHVVRLVAAVGLGLLIFILVVAGLGFFLFSLFAGLAERFTLTGAALATGIVAILLAFLLLLYVRHLLR